MSKQKWEVKSHSTGPDISGEYDGYWEIVNEKCAALRTTDDYEDIESDLNCIANMLNDLDLSVETALEINLHCETQLQKMEIERLKDVLHIDQTGLAAGLAKVNQIVEGYRWVTEGRGPYAWNDDKYKEEMGNMLDNISEAATKALNSSGAIAHSVCCGKEGRAATMEGIGYIKQDAHDKEIETLKAENSKMRKALDEVIAYRFDPDKVTRIATEALKTT